MNFRISLTLVLTALIFASCRERITLVPHTGKDKEIAVPLNSLRLKEHADYDRFEATVSDYKNIYLSLSRLDSGNTRLLQRLAISSLEGEERDVRYAIKVSEKIRELSPTDPDYLYLEMYLKYIALTGASGEVEITKENIAIASDLVKSVEAFLLKIPDYRPPKGVKLEQWKEISEKVSKKIVEHIAASQLTR